MKTTIQLFCSISFFSLFACGQQNNNKPQNTDGSWKEYVDTNCEIEYPDNWDENTSGQMGTRFILFSPLESDSDHFRENVNLLIQDLHNEDIDLALYAELSENQVKTLVTDGEILTSKRQNNENGAHHKLIYNGKQGIFELRFEQYFWIIDDKAYVLTFTSEQDKYDMYKADSDKILKSFQLKIR